MNEERKLQKAKISLMRDPKFALLQGIMMVGKTYVDDTVPTACTDGRDERYGRKFINSLREQELNFVMAHEAGHKMYRHLVTWRRLYDEDRKLANQACDYVINIMLHDLDPHGKTIVMPTYKDGPLKGKPMGMLDERFRGMNSKQVFDILKQERQDGGGGEGGDEQGDGDEDGGSGGGSRDDGFDEHDWGNAKNMSEEDKRQLEREIDQAIRQGIMAQKRVGGGAGGMSRELEEMLQPKVDWREVLREFVKSTCRNKDKSSWRRVNRRMLSGGVYMPSMIGERVGRIVIAVDTSGSIGIRELSDFLSEVKGIAEEVSPEQVDLLYWDCAVAGHEEYREGDVTNIVSTTKPKGGGGTAPSCVSQYLNDKRIQPECVVVLTDGYVGSDWGKDWPAEVLWCIVGNNSVTADNGKTIHIDK
jgi:predicted metal-dependent peptidase